ncbi:MAG: hypothetical protein ACYTGP_10030 [Planctomycetota bacterium]|jgi:hypothetical protein
MFDKRTTVNARAWLVWIALAALVLPATPARAAKLKTYWTNNFITATSRPTPGDNWAQADFITVAAGETIWLAFKNTFLPPPDTQKWLRVDLASAAGSDVTTQLVAQTFRGLGTMTAGLFDGTPPRSLVKPAFNGSYFYQLSWPSCPLWERLQFTNISPDPVQFTVTAMSWCAAQAPDDLNAFRIDTSSLGVPGEMDGLLQVDVIEIYPANGAPDQGVDPGICVPPGTGHWIPEWSTQDPEGTPRPNGGLRLHTDGAGIVPGEPLRIEFQLASPESAYWAFLHDVEEGSWHKFFIGLNAPYVGPFSDELFQPGQGLQDARGWKGFDANPAFDAITAPNPFLSPPLSVDVQGNANPVREFGTGDEGTWFFQTWTFVPGNYQQPPSADPYAGSHLRLYDAYEDGGPYHWSVDIQFDARDQQCKVYVGNGLETVDVPYIVDQWVPIDVVVDLDNDICEVFYDAQPLTQYQWTSGFDGSGGGQPNIAAVDLFAQGSSSIFYDDFVLVEIQPPPCPADLDGDGSVGFGDILQIIGAWGSCACCPEDLNGDGMVGFGDILEVIANWGPCPQ